MSLTGFIIVDQRAQVLEWVSEGGGVTLDGQQRVNADFIIECHGLSSITNDISHSTVVSTHWIRSCLEVCYTFVLLVGICFL